MTEKAAGTSSAHTLMDMAKHDLGYDDFFRLMFEKSGLCMTSLDSKLHLREANMEFIAQFDLRSQGSWDRPFLALLHPTVRKRIGHQLALLTARERDRVGGRIIAVRQDGALLFGDLVAVSTTRPDGSVDAILVVVSRASRVGREQAIVHRRLQLTPMDARILEGVAAGVSTAKLATALHLSRGGVEYRIMALLRMSKAVNRIELVSKAHSMGVFATESWPPTVLPEYIQT